MTLKEFAEANNIGYNLAKQWKRRGRIVTEGDSYKLVTPRPRGVSPLGMVTEDDPRLYEPVTEGDSVTEPSRPYVRSSSGATPERIAEKRQELEAKKAAIAPVTLAEFQALVARVETCERDNAALQRQVDALRDALAITNDGLIGLQQNAMRILALYEGLPDRVADLEASPEVDRPTVFMRDLGPTRIDPPSSGWGA